MSGIRVGVRIPPCDRVDRLATIARRAEELGFDQVWFPDSQLLWRDVFTVLTAAALGTERIGLGSAVTNLATRHPAVVASAARSVAELAPGRFTLGLGVGNSSVGPIGMRQSTGAELRDGLATLRALFAGEEWDFNGVRSRLRDPDPNVPIHMAASGPAICGSPGRSPTVSSCSVASRGTPSPVPPPGCGRVPRPRAAPRRPSR